MPIYPHSTSGGEGGASDTVIVKASDETVNNSNTYQDDADFTFAVEANDIWWVEAVIHYDSATAADIKFQFTAPASTTVRGTCSGLSPSDANNVGVVDLTESGVGRGGGGVGSPRSTSFSLIVIVAGTGGNVTLQWAQNTADLSDTTVLANSVMIIRKLN